MTITGIDAVRTGAPVSATGGILFGDVGVTLPTTAEEEILETLTKGGFIGEDGVVRTVDASDDKIRAWGGDTVKIVRTEHSVTYTYTHLESANANVLKLIHGDDNVVIDSDNQSVKVYGTSYMPPRKAFVIDMLDAGVPLREVIPEGQLTSSGDVNFVHSDVIRYEVTIEAFPTEYDSKPGVKYVSLQGAPTGE